MLLCLNASCERTAVTTKNNFTISFSLQNVAELIADLRVIPALILLDR